MKLLKYFLAFLLLLLLIILIRGFLTPSITYNTSIIIKKPAAEVWNTINHKTSSLDWIEGFTKSELLVGTNGTIGAVSNVYLFEGNNEMIMEETITDIITNEKMSMSYKLGPVLTDYEISLQENEGNTTVSTKTKARGGQFIGKMILPWLEKNMKTNEDKNLQNLKAVLEK